MTVIDVPAPLPREPEPEVQPGAMDVLTDLRAAATAVCDTASWASSHGAPDDFTGDAADAAELAVTAFAGDTEAVGAALERGALAIDRFLDQMARRRSEYVDLMERRSTLNDQRGTLISRINRATEDDVEALRSEARAPRPASTPTSTTSRHGGTGSPATRTSRSWPCVPSTPWPRARTPPTGPGSTRPPWSPSSPGSATTPTPSTGGGRASPRPSATPC